MEINKNVNGDLVTLALSGRLDTMTAPEFEKALDAVFTEAKELILDMKDLEYTSSAGLRAILKAQKVMSKKGNMKLTNVSDNIMEIFTVTGFKDILTIE